MKTTTTTVQVERSSRRLKRTSERAQIAWRRVMREGQAVDQVAVECGIQPKRLERLLLAIGKRRALELG